jgi:hypothetical protein
MISKLLQRIRTKEVYCVISSHWVPEKDTVAHLEDDYACMDCVSDHANPGRFEKYVHNPEELGTVLILDHWSRNDGADEYMHAQGWGYCGLFDKYLLYEDDQGFVTYDEFPTREKATEQYERWFNDGWGAQEDDAYISYESHRPEIYFNGKPLEVWPDATGELTERRMLARIRLEMIRTGFYPNVWIDQGRGSLRLVKEL